MAERIRRWTICDGCDKVTIPEAAEDPLCGKLVEAVEAAPVIKALERLMLRNAGRDRTAEEIIHALLTQLQGEER
jgi:hypothetical protein